MQVVYAYLFSIICVFFRKEAIIFSLQKAKLVPRKENAFYGRHCLSIESERRETIMKNNNQINVPQAREAMDRFKMQAAQDEDVPATS